MPVPHPPFDITETTLFRVGRAVEINAVPETAGQFSKSFSFSGNDSLILATSIPSNTPTSWLKTISVQAQYNNGPPPSPFGLGAHDDEKAFIQVEGQIFKTVVLHQAVQGDWCVKVSSQGQLPFSVDFAVYHPRGNPGAPPMIRPTFRCRACRSVAKALGVAIIAGISLAALPAALISAVGDFLGATTAVAAQFINSLIGDTVDGITEKLCVAVGLCSAER